VSDVATLPIERAEDVFALRQAARVAAAGIGCDEADQVRFATALSELGRESLAGGSRKARAIFTLRGDGALHVAFENFPRSGARVDTGIVGLQAARRLVEDVEVSDGARTSAIGVLMRPRPGAPRRQSEEELRTALAGITSPSALDELRLENRDLIATLSALRERQDQLEQLNGELEETNRGVMAMYAQLADELEETNRGVVALYAEIDDKTVRLNQANEAKSRFLANVSHELRSPVNSVLALARLLLDPASEQLTSAQRQQLALIRVSGSELLLLVNQLLDLAKAESGRIEPDVQSVDLGQLFGELRGALRPLARAGVSLQVAVEPDLPPVETDPQLLGQVLRNLLTNALKFTPDGTVRLHARADSSHSVEITVSDSGIGIAREDIERIFEEFYQVRGPLQAEQKGTGLGLPYARRLTQTLGGEMAVESDPGRGSTFTIRLPLLWQPLLRAVRTPGQQPARAVSVPTVLIVDDDDGFRTALRGMLQGVAGQVLEARGGIEGLKLLRERAPTLAFLDLCMPDLDGAAVLAEMSGDPALRAIPVVIVTSVELSPNVRTTLGSAAALLAKSNISREVVQGAIADALDHAVLPT